MKLKETFIVGLIIVIFVTLSMCIPQVVRARTINLKIASGGNAQDFHARAVFEFCNLVKERTNGEVNIKYYPDGQLGSKDQMMTGLKLGTIDMVRSDFDAFSVICEEAGVFNLPYAYKDVEHADRVTSPSSSVFQKVNNIMKEKGVRFIGNIYYGTRHMTGNDPIKKPADLKGKKFRVVPTPIWIAMAKGMGGVPTPVEFSELATSLASGMVSHLEMPLSTIYNAKLYQLQKYLMLTGHMIGYVAVGVNEKTWQKLSENHQQIILQALKDAKEIWKKKSLEVEDGFVPKLKEKGMTVIGPEEGLDVIAFRESVQAVCKKDFPQWVGYMDEMKAIK